jgi:predicted MFS family arabinose efflux permease
MRTLPADQHTYRTSVDFAGACMLMAGVLGILFPINQLPASGLSVTLGVIFAAGVGLLALFVRRELRIAHPLIRISFFTNPTFCLAIAIAFCMMFGYFGGFVLTPIYLETALGVTLSVTSLIMIGRPFSMSLSSPIWVRLPGSWARRGPILGALLSVISMCVFAFGAWNHLLVAFIVGNVLGGLALGVANPGLTARLISSVNPEDYGSAAGVQSMFTQIASVLGLSVLAGVASRGGTSVHAHSFALAYLIGAVVAVGSIVLAAYLNIRVPEASPQPRLELAAQDG